jgi:hypothetical protein
LERTISNFATTNRRAAATAMLAVVLTGRAVALIPFHLCDQ